MIKVLWKLVFGISFLFATALSGTAGNGPETERKTAGILLKNHLNAIAIQGPLSDMELRVNGQSVFLPPSLPEDLDQAEKAEQLFQLATKHFMPWDASLETGLAALIYGYGFGFCGEHAKFLANLWFHHGIPARTVSLPNHVMVEAQVDAKWRLYDPQHGINFSQLFGKPTSFADMLEAKLPQGTDPAGFSWSYLNGIYHLAEPSYSQRTEFVPPPALSVPKGCVFTIRRREAGEYFRLPIVYKRRPDYQSNLLNFDVVEISYVAREGDGPVSIPAMLPILNVSWSGGDPSEIMIAGKQGPIGMDALNEAANGKILEMKAAMPPGSRLVMTCALAGWIGRRIFEAEAGSRLTVAARELPKQPVLTYREEPDLKLGPIRIQADGIGPGQHRVELDLIWSNLDLQGPQQYEIVLDEHETHILMDYLAHVGKRSFQWDPAVHGPSGKWTMTFAWTPETQKTKRVPYRNRLLLAHLIGSGLTAGRHYQITSFREDSNAPAD